MPTVPYNPVPTVAPTQQPTPNIGVPSVPDAFGAGIGQAIQGVGKIAEHVGDELFSRAIAMQQLANETEAKEADAKYMISAGELHANYSALQGQEAVKAYPKYTKDLDDLRKSMRNGLSNPMAAKMFDSSSLSTMGRTIFNGAGHAATMNKQWAIGTAVARIDAQKSAALSQPNDDAAFNKGIETITNEVKAKGSLGGWGQDQIDNQTSHEVSGAWVNRIDGLSRTQPYAAKAMLEANRDKIRGQDRNAIDEKVRSRMHNVGSHNISDAVNSGWAPYMKSLDSSRAIGVEDSLIAVVKEAQRAHPEIEFTIGDKGGKRTPQEQTELVAKGVSQTYHSDHMNGRAIDLVPLTNGQPDYKNREGYAAVSAAMKEASEKLGIPLADKSPGFQQWDPAHYSLPKDYDVSKAPDIPEEPLGSRVDRAKRYAEKFDPVDTMFADTVRDRTMSDFNRAKSIQRDADYTSRNILDGAIVGGYGDKLPTTVDELKATDPKVAAAWDALPETKQRPYYKALINNAKEDFTWNRERMARYKVLGGMAEEDPVEFMNKDINDEKLPNSAKKELIKLQVKKKTNAESDPRVTHAMSILAPDLQAAGITKDKDKEGYYQFIGSLQDALTDFAKDNKAKPKMEEVQKIGRQLLQQQHSSAHWFPWSTDNMFNRPVPEKDLARIKSNPAWAELGIEPTPEMIKRQYAREEFKELYGKKEAKP